MKKPISRKIKSSLALLLAVVMCVSMLPVSTFAMTASELETQIKNTYSSTLSRASVSSFNGYCGLYVNWQLVVLGINTSYIGANGNGEYDNYKNLSKSSGGYNVKAYPASSYSLESALNTITSNGTKDAYNILVGFEKGSGDDGALYGHTCFIHGIIGGTVYWSESFSGSGFPGGYHQEGAPINCSISQFANYYNSWTVLDGVIHFAKEATYSVSYNANGGIGAPNAQTKTEGQALTLSSAVPTRTGYTFKGWATSASGSVAYASGASFTTDANTTLYAVWQKNTYTVSFCNYDGTQYAQKTASYGDYTIPSGYPARSGYYFSGWAYSANAEVFDVRPGDTISVTNSITLYPLYVSYEELISGEPVLIYNIADFTDSGFAVSEVDYNIAGTETQYTWSDWSSWGTDAVTASETTEVETATLYRYYYYLCPNCGRHEGFYGTSDCGGQIPSNSVAITWSTVPYSQSNSSTYVDDCGTTHSEKRVTTSLGDGQKWYFSTGNLNSTSAGTTDSDSDAVVITTGYRYRTRSESEVASSKTVKAYKVTSVPKYTVTYDANGGTGAPAAQTKIYNVSLTLSSAAPTKANSAFLGWAKTASATAPDYLAGGTYSGNEAIKLYAVWLDNACYVDTVWSDWSTTKPTGVAEGMIETKTQYRYRDKTTTTSSNSSMSGWTLYDSVSVWSDYGDWSSWGTDAVTASETTEVETATLYRYYYYLCPNCGRHEGFYGTSDCGGQIPSNSVAITWSTVSYSQSNSSTYVDDGGTTHPEKRVTTSLGDGQKWYFSTGNLNSTAVGTSDSDSDAVVITTGYRYRTRTQNTTYYFYKWSDWSAWSDTSAAATGNREIEFRTLYRYCTQTAHDHSWNSGVVTKGATCEEDGVKTYTCSHCSKTKTEVIPKHDNHTWSAWQVTKEATCKDEGIKTRTCSVCGKVETQVIAKLSTHTWGAWQVTKEATCCATGIKTRTCTVCGETETETIPVTSTHKLSYISARAATVSSTGNIEYWYCTECHKYFSDSAGTKEITQAQTVIPKLDEPEPDPDAMQITLTGGQVILNNEIQVKVNISGNPGIASVTADVVYDKTKLTLISATSGISTGSWVDLDDIAESGSFLWYSTDNYTSDGTIITLTFKANSDAAIGDTTVSIACDDDFSGIFDADGGDVSYNITAATVSISDRKPGDINGDNKVNGADIILLAQYVKAKGAGIDIVAGSADTNGDGKTNGADIILLAQYVKAKGVGVTIH